MMTTRDVHTTIEDIDQQLARLQPWEATLTARRTRAVAEGQRAMIDFIDAGPARGAGRPADPDFVPFDRGLPGLVTTRADIAALQERRVLLAEQLPSKAQTAAKVKEAEALAADVRALAERQAACVVAFEQALATLKPLALDVADATRRLGEGNKRLDTLTAAADISRPDTPRLTSTLRIDSTVAQVVQTAEFYRRNAGR